jgi:hypothetical protein
MRAPSKVTKEDNGITKRIEKKPKLHREILPTAEALHYSSYQKKRTETDFEFTQG